ncbi:hypothetical protein GCM10010245_71260 [Streptomyces spectabilis]|uniref:Uncharacterized protein n=1 Tax=Streptomyces spectabilis TaxID=68270 RepID=A0A5P2X5X3_STRST|nr:hypothetical protein CP982_07225 [Streptomyces spectabilis]GGV45538.1 hypothetical protein GCM10010245_71260 [Streptomyces spectabilis]
MILLLDGDERPAAAGDLRRDEAGSWGGSLAFPVEARTPHLLNLTEGRLSIRGQEGSFVRPDTSDWVNSPTGQFRIRIEGSGDAPF